MDIKIDTQNKYISMTSASEITGRTSAEIEQLCRSGKLSSKIVSGEWYLSEASLLDYFNVGLASNIPLSHLIERKTDSKKEQIFVHRPDFSALMGKTVNILTAFTLVFGGYYVLATPDGRSAGREVIAYVQKALDQSTDMMAFVGYSVLGTVESSNPANAFSTLQDFLYPKEKVAKSSALLVSPTDEGSENKATRERIQNSFSDEVRVIPDKGGKSGIIKPVFKKSTDQSYMYVMVPVGN